jgi:aldehyde:ferredoxin oxidoreductase
MSERLPSGYAGRVMHVDLSSGRVTSERLDAATLRRWIGGTGLGTKYLMEMVPPGMSWDDPGNPVILASGPLAGTKVSGTGTFSAVFKGPMTDQAGATQANGYLGAFLRQNGYDAIVLVGRAERPVYLYIHDGTAELRDAAHLWGVDTWQVEDLVRAEHGATERGMSVFSIGPAGERLVRFAALVGDRGHVAAHNGVGAVLGAKRLKAIATARGKQPIPVHDPARLNGLIEPFFVAASENRTSSLYQWGTGGGVSGAAIGGWLPVKNYTTCEFPEHEQVNGQFLRTRFKIKNNPCWACRMGCCKLIEVTEGPYAGFKGEEPEYEGLAAFGPQVGISEAGAVVKLANEADAWGFDLNEGGWVCGFAIEAFDRGLITKEMLGGLELGWGDPEAARELIRKVAFREDFGAVLAEGVKRAAEHLAAAGHPEALEIGVYTLKGCSPRGHDHRGRWAEMFDTCLSNTSTIEATFGGIQTQRLGLPPQRNRFDPEEIATLSADFNGWHQFDDCLGVCRFCNTHAHMAVDVLNAVTGWDMTLEEAMEIGKRIVNQLRVFNFRHGLDPATERPSPRYGSTPTDGPNAGIGIMEHWDGMVRAYRERMGWEPETGRPRPETLERLGLAELVGTF